MNIVIEPGRYVVAVSGGVDSVALLHMLSAQPGLKLTVAHYDHGIRPESKEDRLFVQDLAAKHGLPFVYDEGELGANASEAAARTARYKFLHQARVSSGAKAIITAHHEDDLLETAIINLLRGTGRKGLSSLKTTDVITRPLLHLSKADLLAYAHHHGLKWHEDSTNSDTKYLRNKIRHNILARVASSDRQKLATLVKTVAETNHEIDNILINELHQQPKQGTLDRHWFIMLPHIVAREVMASWLRLAGIKDIDRKKIERLVTATKTLASGKTTDVDAAYFLKINGNEINLVARADS